MPTLKSQLARNRYCTDYSPIYICEQTLNSQLTSRKLNQKVFRIRNIPAKTMGGRSRASFRLVELMNIIQLEEACFYDIVSIYRDSIRSSCQYLFFFELSVPSFFFVLKLGNLVT